MAKHAIMSSYEQVALVTSAHEALQAKTDSAVKQARGRVKAYTCDPKWHVSEAMNDSPELHHPDMSESW